MQINTLHSIFEKAEESIFRMYHVGVCVCVGLCTVCVFQKCVNMYYVLCVCERESESMNLFWVCLCVYLYKYINVECVCVFGVCVFESSSEFWFCFDLETFFWTNRILIWVLAYYLVFYLAIDVVDRHRCLIICLLLFHFT